MNRTRTGKNVKRLIVWLLMLTMVFSLLPMAAFADEAVEEPVQEPAESAPVEPEEPAEPSVEPEEPTDEPTDEESTDEEPVDEEEEVVVARYTGNDGFLRMFHLDCGRKYFSVSDIEQIIDKLAENNYTHIQLAFGNNGFRFLLGNGNMEITLDNGAKYTDQQVRDAIISGNNSYSSSKGADASMLSESDMTGIISYAKGKGIGVIPMLNTPGHMDALVSAMNTLGIRSSAGSEMSLTSDKEVEFIKALQQKYITYFASQGCDHYNLAADEYSFGGLNNEECSAQTLRKKSSRTSWTGATQQINGAKIILRSMRCWILQCSIPIINLLFHSRKMARPYISIVTKMIKRVLYIRTTTIITIAASA